MTFAHHVRMTVQTLYMFRVLPTPKNVRSVWFAVERAHYIFRMLDER